MGAIPSNTDYGVFRFLDPDLSVPAHERATFAGPASKSAKEERLELHDFRTSNDISKGVRGLDDQGFTYVDHVSSLNAEELLTGTNTEETYCPEIIDLMLRLTDGSRAVVHDMTFRRKLSTTTDIYHVNRRGAEIDQIVAKLPKDRILVNGREGEGQEPNRHAHCDMVLESLRDTLTMCRRDILEAARPTLEAEKTRKAGAKTPRFAAYSVWRPLKTVRRDPIAVLDYRSINKSELVETDFRCPSELTDEGEYIIKAWLHKPPNSPEALRWYWVPQQRPEEVLIIKFSDSASAEDENVAAGCIHCSPVLLSTENEETRTSVECRVYVFWD